jgi:hypothetical protein
MLSGVLADGCLDIFVRITEPMAFLALVIRRAHALAAPGANMM